MFQTKKVKTFLGFNAEVYEVTTSCFEKVGSYGTRSNGRFWVSPATCFADDVDSEGEAIALLKQAWGQSSVLAETLAIAA